MLLDVFFSLFAASSSEEAEVACKANSVVVICIITSSWPPWSSNPATPLCESSPVDSVASVAPAEADGLSSVRVTSSSDDDGGVVLPGPAECVVVVDEDDVDVDNGDTAAAAAAIFLFFFVCSCRFCVVLCVSIRNR